MDDRVYAPWTENELYKISLAQGNYDMRPHVCPVHTKRALVAISTLLFCIECGYTQNWVSTKFCSRKEINE